MTGAEIPASNVPSRTATPSSHNLNRPRVAGAANSSVRIARDLFWLRISAKDEDNLTSFFMTSPQFERLHPRYSRNQKSLELVPHPNSPKTPCQARFSRNQYLASVFLLFATSANPQPGWGYLHGFA